MYIPKKYGMSKIDECPFCGAHANFKNSQNISVCKDHKNEVMPDMKCACGGYLDLRMGKFGAFYTCFKCGTVSMKKALEINQSGAGKETKKVAEKTNSSVSSNSANNNNDDDIYDTDFEQKPKKKEYVDEFILDNVEVVRSDDPRYFD